jgi:hypothetical protein
MSKEDWKGACLHPDCVAVVEWLSGKMPNSAVKCVAFSEAELAGVAGGMIKQPGPERPAATASTISGHELIEATPWSSPYVWTNPYL